MSVILNASAQGLLWAVMAIGVYITYRILDIADLTAEGCFTLGAAVTCKLITSGVSPLASTAAALVAGLLAGLITGVLHTKFKIPALLSGILTMTALWSINLRVMGKSNIPLLKKETLLTALTGFGIAKDMAAIVAGLILTVLVIAFLWWFFNTELGYVLRATGDNKNMIRAQGVNTDKTIIIGVMLGNGLIALSASLVAQYNSFADISMGIGTIVIGLASVIIGEVVFGHRTILHSLIAVALGSVLYRIIIALVLALGLRADDMKLISAVLLVIALCFPNIKELILKPIKNSIKKGGSENA